MKCQFYENCREEQCRMFGCQEYQTRRNTERMAAYIITVALLYLAAYALIT